MLTETRTAAARAVDLRKVFGEGLAAVEALRGVSVEFAAGEYTAIMGASGSGKSTLLHCMAGLDKPTSGTVWIGDQDLTQLKDRDLTEIRRDRIGFVFQAFNLVPTLSAAENITLPADIAGRKVDGERFDEVIDTIGLRDRLTHLPSELSGGQQQRVAAARALVSRPGDRVRGRAHGEPRLARLAGAADVPQGSRDGPGPDDRRGDPRSRSARATRIGSCSSRTVRSWTRCGTRRPSASSTG